VRSTDTHTSVVADNSFHEDLRYRPTFICEIVICQRSCLVAVVEKYQLPATRVRLLTFWNERKGNVGIECRKLRILTATCIRG
jgi:hypothetical protein